MRGFWSIISLIGVGVIVTLIFYFLFTSLGIYGKAGKPEGMILNIIGAIIFILVSHMDGK